jgi:head-tail adaptor|tara:strand:+ start:2097 stop:2447 length:351 start_codon:yes stop_codon:yes gene_type:complete
MRAGQLRKRVNWKKQSATPNDTGEAVYTYTTQTSGDPAVAIPIPAGVRNISRRMTTNNGLSQPLGEETWEIRIRYRAEMSLGDRITYNGTDYVIRGMENVKEIDHELVLTCEVADV